MRNLSARSRTALTLGRAAGATSRALRRGGGTTLPGHVARFVDPGVAGSLAGRLAGGAVLVSGTNGKTTTTRLLSAMLRESGRQVVHNRSGANLMTGVTTALLDEQGDVGLFEIDEAALPAAITELRPRLVLCLNLFRDQLDRYGELNTLAAKWKTALAALSAETTVLLNADDPLVGSLGEGLTCRVVYFGLELRASDSVKIEHAADSLYCPRCGGLLEFAAVSYGHLGRYSCSGCGFARPHPSFSGADIRLSLDAPTHLQVNDLALETSLAGLYNVYNVIAATAAALSLGVEGTLIQSAVSGFGAAFGRGEVVDIDGKQLKLLLAKNPVGYNEVIRTLLLDPEPLHVYLALNDRIADGEDVSWIWDVDFERLADRCGTLIVGGTRAEDLAVRLKYSGLAPERMAIVQDHGRAIGQLLSDTPAAGRAYAVPTYTAMLDLRQSLAASGVLRRFWED